MRIRLSGDVSPEPPEDGLGEGRCRRESVGMDFSVQSSAGDVCKTRGGSIPSEKPLGTNEASATVAKEPFSKPMVLPQVHASFPVRNEERRLDDLQPVPQSHLRWVARREPDRPARLAVAKPQERERRKELRVFGVEPRQCSGRAEHLPTSLVILSSDRVLKLLPIVPEAEMLRLRRIGGRSEHPTLGGSKSALESSRSIIVPLRVMRASEPGVGVLVLAHVGVRQGEIRVVDR